MNVLSELFFAADSLVQFVLLVILARGAFRRYLLFSCYVLAEFAVDVVEGVSYYGLGLKTDVYRKIFWTDHLTLDILLFMVLIVLIYEALRESPLRQKAGQLLAIVAVATFVLPLTMLRDHYNRRYGFFTSQWFNHVSQIWNFGAGIMNLVLWAALLTNRRRDPRLVTLSIGFGLLTASAAIAWGVREWFQRANRGPVDSFMMLSHLACLLVWCWAFRAKPRSAPGSPAPPKTTPPDTAPPNALTTPS